MASGSPAERMIIAGREWTRKQRSSADRCVSRTVASLTLQRLWPPHTRARQDGSAA